MLSIWLLGAVALSVLAMGGLTAWNLRQGFSAYLHARDLERLDAFVALVADRLAQADASTTALPDMNALLRGLAVRVGDRVPAPPLSAPPRAMPGEPPGKPPGEPPRKPPANRRATRARVARPRSRRRPGRRARKTASARA